MFLEHYVVRDADVSTMVKHVHLEHVYLEKQFKSSTMKCQGVLCKRPLTEHRLNFK